jgi:zinc protease
MTAERTGADGLAVLDERPIPGAPREYRFPSFERSTLPNGLDLIRAHVPGRPLLQALLLVRDGPAGAAAGEPLEAAGVTVLAARAMPEGTVRRDAQALVEAAERLGAELGAEAGWESLLAHVEVPRARLGPALELLAEMALEPSFPEREVDRLRDERLNDLRQAQADPRRRAERVFPETIYAPGLPYARPLGGTEGTVSGLDRDRVAGRHAALMRPGAATLIVCGDLDGPDVPGLAAAAFGGWRDDSASGSASGEGGEGRATDDPAPPPVEPHPDGPRVVVVDRPGAPQSEVRVGHVGLARRVPDFHAVTVMNMILGGLFSSRLMQLLREERGYTYGCYSAFDVRRSAGPFAVRCAVHTDVTVPAIGDILGELRRIREAPVEADELALFRDYLVGVFPLRFETSGQVATALSGLVAHDLPDDELDRYRPAIAAVTAEDVLAAARAHVRPDEASIVVVGDAARFEADLRAADLGEVTVVRDPDAVPPDAAGAAAR